MKRSEIVLFDVAGFTVKVDWSWAIIAVLIAWSLAEGLFPSLYVGLPPLTYWWMGVAGVIGLFLSILLHELSHSVVARYYKVPIRGITLFIFGGVAELEDEPHSPKIEFRMAIVGPLVSLGLGGLLYLSMKVGQGAAWPEPVIGILHYLMSLNIVLALFNLVPGFPLDGGRVLRAVLWARWHDLHRATRVASKAGVWFGIVLMGLGALSVLGGDLGTGIWWILIGLFLRNAAAGAYYDLRTRELMRSRKVRDFMSGSPIAVNPEMSIQRFVDEFVLRYHHEFYPVVIDGRIIGSISLAQIRTVPRDSWASKTVGDVLVPLSDENAIEAEIGAMAALRAMQRHKATRLMVIDGGILVGILALKDLLKSLSLEVSLKGDL
jgi:Zn-dependent protease/CBS domain-containing protein